MKRILTALLLLGCAAAWAQSGPGQAWNVFTLPNEAVTPNWKSNKAYLPGDCRRKPDACADDHRFWEEWDFKNDFGSGASVNAIDAAFAAVKDKGKYQSVMLQMPLTDAGHFRANFTEMSNAAKAHLVTIQPVLFPKWKYGAEWCYLYPDPAASNVASSCPPDPVTGKNAFETLVDIMDFTLGQVGCPTNGPTLRFAIWYGWSTSEFPQQDGTGQILWNFWHHLPTSGPTNKNCNLRDAYITWLDTGYTTDADAYAYHYLNPQQWFDTELYSDQQITDGFQVYSPNQTVITGYWNASSIASWATGMCSKWKEASSPAQFGVWTFYDRDVDRPYELYRSYINNQMAVIGSICPN